jgi:hypothetical protein
MPQNVASRVKHEKVSSNKPHSQRLNPGAEAVRHIQQSGSAAPAFNYLVLFRCVPAVATPGTVTDRHGRLLVARALRGAPLALCCSCHSLSQNTYHGHQYHSLRTENKNAACTGINTWSHNVNCSKQGYRRLKPICI